MAPLLALLRLTRFWNLMIVGLTQYCAGYFLVAHEVVFTLDFFLLTGSTVLVAAAGYIINDYYDVKIDLINKPDRVVVGKIISRRLALLSHGSISVLAIATGFYLNWRIGLIHIASVFLLWLYSNALKRLPFIGNFTVAILTGVVVLMVGICFPPVTAMLGVYALFALFMTLVREIIKDIEDLKGDNAFGCKTLPIVWGVRATRQFTIGLLTLFAATVWVIHWKVTPLPMEFFAGFLFLPMLLLLVWLWRADTRKSFSMLSQFCKLMMLAGIGSMAFL